MSMENIVDTIAEKLRDIYERLRVVEEQQPGVRHAYNKSVAPGVGDDINDGFSVGSFWHDTNSLPADIYVCRDNASGAASWYKLT